MRLNNNYFILRHGENIYQTKKKKFAYPWPERTPVRLTKRGKKEVGKNVKLLKGKKIDLIFSSPAFRAKQTAEIAAKEVGVKKIRFDRRLQDINWGIYRGGLKEDFYKNFPKYSKERFYKKPKKGESWLDCQKRALNFFKETEKSYKNKTILIVSHGDPLWLLEGAVKNWSPEKLIKANKLNLIKTGELRKLSKK